MRPTTRRAFLRVASLGAAAVATLRPPRGVAAELHYPIAVPNDPQEAIRAVIGNVKPTKGKVALDMPYITETGNSVAVTVKVDSPMTDSDHVTALHLFGDGNPVPRIASFQLGPRAGRVDIALRIRLARSQRVIAIAQLSDG